MAKKSSETAPFYVIRDGDRLIGEMEMDREMIREFPAGQRIKVDLYTGRVPSRLRFYRAFLREVRKATHCAVTDDALHGAVKLGTGFTEDVKLAGYIVKIPASVAFRAMDEQTFGIFLNEALAFIAREYGITPEDVEKAA
jgi:hypothetical protein